MRDDLQEIQQRMARLGRRDVTKALEENQLAAAKLVQLLRAGAVEQARDVAEALALSFQAITKELL